MDDRHDDSARLYVGLPTQEQRDWMRVQRAVAHNGKRRRQQGRPRRHPPSGHCLLLLRPPGRLYWLWVLDSLHDVQNYGSWTRRERYQRALRDLHRERQRRLRAPGGYNAGEGQQ